MTAVQSNQPNGNADAAPNNDDVAQQHNSTDETFSNKGGQPGNKAEKPTSPSTPITIHAIFFFVAIVTWFAGILYLIKNPLEQDWGICDILFLLVLSLALIVISTGSPVSFFLRVMRKDGEWLASQTDRVERWMKRQGVLNKNDELTPPERAIIIKALIEDSGDVSLARQAPSRITGAVGLFLSIVAAGSKLHHPELLFPLAAIMVFFVSGSVIRESLARDYRGIAILLEMKAREKAATLPQNRET